MSVVTRRRGKSVFTMPQPNPKMVSDTSASSGVHFATTPRSSTLTFGRGSSRRSQICMHVCR